MSDTLPSAPVAATVPVTPVVPTVPVPTTTAAPATIPPAPSAATPLAVQASGKYRCLVPIDIDDQGLHLEPGDVANFAPATVPALVAAHCIEPVAVSD